MKVDITNNQSFDIPILLLVFNRPNTTQEVFQRIKQIKPKRLYVASDGPRIGRIGEEEKVKTIRKLILESTDWDVELKILFRETNLGCSKSVFSAIDWFFENEEMGIILEDDCLPNISFFQFCETNLIRYKYDNRISAITGDNFFAKSMVTDSYFFSRFIFIWGWATWRRTWEYHREVLKNFESIINLPLKNLSISHINADRFIIKNACKAFSGEINTWDYQWILSNYLYHGLVITPKVNLVKNIGFDSDATHTTGKTNIMKVGTTELEFPLTHPTIFVPNKDYDNHLYNDIFNWGYLVYFRIILQNFKNIIKKII
jgi:hypothetical protein